MARAIEDLEREIRELSNADKERLFDFLITETDGPPADLDTLVAAFCSAVDGINDSLAATLDRLDGLDDRIAQSGRKARYEVLHSDIRWPFTDPDPGPS